MDIFDYICLGICCFHVICLIYEFIHNLFIGKKINKLCEKCGLPVFSDTEHDCALSSHQIKKLYEFVNSVRGDKNGN